MADSGSTICELSSSSSTSKRWPSSAASMAEQQVTPTTGTVLSRRLRCRSAPAQTRSREWAGGLGPRPEAQQPQATVWQAPSSPTIPHPALLLPQPHIPAHPRPPGCTHAPFSAAASSARMAAASAGLPASFSISRSSAAAPALARLSLACSDWASRRRETRRSGPTRKKSEQPDSSRPGGSEVPGSSEEEQGEARRWREAAPGATPCHPVSLSHTHTHTHTPQYNTSTSNAPTRTLSTATLVWADTSTRAPASGEPARPCCCSRKCSRATSRVDLPAGRGSGGGERAPQHQQAPQQSLKMHRQGEASTPSQLTAPKRAVHQAHRRGGAAAAAAARRPASHIRDHLCRVAARGLEPTVCRPQAHQQGSEERCAGWCAVPHESCVSHLPAPCLSQTSG